MRKATLGVIALLLIAFISGCINQTQTVTVTKTVTNTAEEKTTSQTKPTITETNTPTSITTMSHTQNKIQVDCSKDDWRNDFEKALTCALRPEQNHNFDPVFSLSLTGNKTKDALIITDFLVNYVPLDSFTENQSMKKGYYYNIKTPYELFQYKTGTYADMAIFGAYALARDGFETYVFYINTKNGFGALPGFKLRVNHPWVPTEPFVILWPFRIPIRLSAALKFLEIVGETPINMTLYEIKYENGKYFVENLGTVPTSEFKFRDLEFTIFGGPNIKTMNKLLQQSGFKCKYTTNLSEFTREKLIEKKLEFPYGVLFYSVPFEERYTEILYTIIVQDEEFKKDILNCVAMAARNWEIGEEYTAVYSFWINK